MVKRDSLGRKLGHRGRKRPPKGETRRDKFLRLAPTRLAIAVKKIRLLSNFARGNYQVLDSDVAIFREQLQRAVDAVIGTYAKGTSRVAASMEREALRAFAGQKPRKRKKRY